MKLFTGWSFPGLLQECMLTGNETAGQVRERDFIAAWFGDRLAFM